MDHENDLCFELSYYKSSIVDCCNVGYNLYARTRCSKACFVITSANQGEDLKVLQFKKRVMLLLLRMYSGKPMHINCRAKHF